MSITAYPLQWPVGWRRTAAGARTPARFSKGERRRNADGSAGWMQHRDLTIEDGRRRVLAELERMGLRRDDVVLSTNLVLRLDGEVRSGQREPEDPGVAVYWQERGGERRVMAIDQYTRVADNLAAVAATLDAMRAIERHGGAVVLERAYTGFTALPAPTAPGWRGVLGFTATEIVGQDRLKEAYRRLRGEAHPDRPGGSAERFDAIERAYREATAA